MQWLPAQQPYKSRTVCTARRMGNGEAGATTCDASYAARASVGEEPHLAVRAMHIGSISTTKPFTVFVVRIAEYVKALARLPARTAEAATLARAPAAVALELVGVAPLLALLYFTVSLVTRVAVAEVAAPTLAERTMVLHGEPWAGYHRQCQDKWGGGNERTSRFRGSQKSWHISWATSSLMPDAQVDVASALDAALQKSHC